MYHVDNVALPATKKGNNMDQITMLMSGQLTEREVMIYLLIENTEMTNRELGFILGVSYEKIRQAHKSATRKITKLAAAGMYQTDL